MPRSLFTSSTGAVLLAGALALAGCKTSEPCDCDAEPSGPAASQSTERTWPTLELAERVSAQGSLYLIGRDVDGLAAQGRALFASGESMRASMRETFLDELGVDPLDPVTWEGIGLETTRPMIVSVRHEPDLVLTAHVRDVEKMRAWIASITGEEVAPHPTLEGGFVSGSRAAWYEEEEGELVHLALGDVDELLLMCQACQRAPSSSLAEVDGFVRFHQGYLSKAPGGMFVPPRGELFAESFEEMFRSSEPFDALAMARVVSQFTGLGAVGQVGEDASLEGRLWVGMKPLASARAREALTAPTSFDPSPYLLDSTLGFVHLSGSPERLTERVTAMLSAEAYGGLEELILEAEQQLGQGFELRRDLIAALGGHLMIVAWATGQPDRALLDIEGMTVALILDFRDEEGAERVVQLLGEQLEHVAMPFPREASTLGQGDQAVRLLRVGPPDNELLMYGHGGQLMVTGASISEEDVARMLRGQAPPSPLRVEGRPRLQRALQAEHAAYVDGEAVRA